MLCLATEQQTIRVANSQSSEALEQISRSGCRAFGTKSL